MANAGASGAQATPYLYVETISNNEKETSIRDPAPEWHPKGYPKLSNLLGHYPEAAVFRRFGALGMINLLSLQAELISLETELRELWQEDDESSISDVRNYTSDFYRLRRSKAPNDDQLKLLNESRQKLEQYYSLLAKMQSVTQMEPPRPDQLSFIRNWQLGSKEGNAFLQGSEVDTWAKRHEDDFVVFDKSNDVSQFEKWLSPTLLQWYERTWGSPLRSNDQRFDPESGRIIDERDSVVVKTTKVVGYTFAVVLASLLPVLAILALYYEKNTPKRIYITIGFTAAIGLWLSAFTSAKVNEVFAATAAFAAIEVVFIGTANA